MCSKDLGGIFNTLVHYPCQSSVTSFFKHVPWIRYTTSCWRMALERIEGRTVSFRTVRRDRAAHARWTESLLELWAKTARRLLSDISTPLKVIA